jgi:hypothetical protein
MCSIVFIGFVHEFLLEERIILTDISCQLDLIINIIQYLCLKYQVTGKDKWEAAYTSKGTQIFNRNMPIA